MNKTMLAALNRVGARLPKAWQRRIVDSRGALYLLERLSRGQFSDVSTPEGYVLVINPLFHSNLAPSGSVGNYEPDIQEVVKQQTQPAMVAWDVGANVGVFSLLFRYLVGEGGKVYAFEPEPNNTVCFEKMVQRNGLTNVFLDTRAVSNRHGRESFDRRGGAFSGRLVGGNTEYGATENVNEVEVVSVDHLVENEGYSAPDIIKMDVEGNELLVLEGMKECLGRKGPVVICEIHSHLGESGNEVLELLSQQDYEITDVETGETAGPADPGRPRHVLAVKRSGKQRGPS